ncbi:CLUMA_CG015246, isoform A [Clunio marinus]|uniref:CLUMA_CG015246, isoform A n=1 Tax=Clunio marinus TaxID=568069 RepID=A0A1J1IS49_9DIPT|nr:CLUMA_CG015246, isoform A [Clunio marinus]
MKNILVAIFAFVSIYNVVQSATPPAKTDYFITNSKSLNYKLVGKKEEHRFGLELDDNKQFHHTRTAEDGVRLGCYGYELEGKKYTTNYVADAKGYRLTPKTGVVTVYPKDGGEPRKATFVKEFGMADVKTPFARYTFPDGCEAPGIEYDKIVIIEKKDDVIEIPTETPEPETTTFLPEETTIYPEIPVPYVASVIEPICCDDNLSKLVLPRADSECNQTAKLIVPIEMHIINRIPLSDIAEISKETNTVIMLLKLLKLVEKCKHMY